MNRKKLLLVTGIMTASLVTALAITINDFNQDHLNAYAGNNTAYALIVNSHTSSVSNGDLVYQRDDGKQFFFSTNGVRSDDELITLGPDEYLEMVTPAWGIETVTVNFVGDGAPQNVFGYAKLNYDPVEDDGKHGNRAFGQDYAEQGLPFLSSATVALYSAKMPYLDNSEEKTEEEFLPNILKIKNCDESYTAIIDSIIIEYSCH